MYLILRLAVATFLLDKCIFCQESSECELSEGGRLGFRCPGPDGACVEMKYLFDYEPSYIDICLDREGEGSSRSPKAMEFLLEHCRDTNTECGKKGCPKSSEEYDQCCLTCKSNGFKCVQGVTKHFAHRRVILPSRRKSSRSLHLVATDRSTVVPEKNCAFWRHFFLADEERFRATLYFMPVQECKNLPSVFCNGQFDCEDEEGIEEDSTHCAFCKYMLALDAKRQTARRSMSRSSSNQTQKRHLIKTSGRTPAIWMTEDEMHTLRQKKIRFMDLTHRKPLKRSRSRSGVLDYAAKERAIPKTVRFGSIVRKVHSHIEVARIAEFIKQFSRYKTRHSRSPTGIEASEWLFNYIKEIITKNKYSDKTTIQFVAIKPDWEINQKTIVVRILGTDPIKDGEVIILGAHLDSTTKNTNPTDTAPGADDNGSGVGAILEAFRGLLESGFVPRRTLEFHFYAAEEEGLIGSGDLAENYEEREINAISMLNLDVVGYFTKETTITFMWDYTSHVLNEFLIILVEAFLNNVKWSKRCCGYACSDDLLPLGQLPLRQIIKTFVRST